MLTWKVKSVVALLAVTTLMEAFPQDADAFIFRWLRERRAARLAYYSGYAPGCGTPAVAYRPTVTPQPACGSCAAPAPCAPACPAPCPPPCTTTQRVCSYCPQTCYRTVYRQVPVTVYRPVTTCDPCTGCPRTCMQPCTTVKHVAQRVPYTTYRQVCREVQVPVAQSCNTCASPVTPTVVQQQFSAPAQQYAPASPGCCGSAPSASIPQATPYAAAPQQQYAPAPATQMPMQSVPQRAPSSSLAPTPAPATGSNNGNTPANQIPTLPQSTYQGSNYQPNSQSGTIQGSSSRTSADEPATYEPRPQHPDIRPLPDLDRAPPLLNPDDRTAALDTRPAVAAGTIVPISWQTAVEEEVDAQVDHQPSSYAKPKVRRLDDSGWRAARSF